MPSAKNVEQALALIKNDESRLLGLTIGTLKVAPGVRIPKAEAQAVPELSLQSANPSTTYLAIGLDIDAPFPSLTILGPILHWIQPGFTADPTPAADGTTSLKTTEPFVANYIGPAPPPGSSPHRYVVLLYEQPQGFDGKKLAPPNGAKVGNFQRMRWDLEAWGKEVGLGEVVAVNYFVSN